MYSVFSTLITVFHLAIRIEISVTKSICIYQQNEPVNPAIILQSFTHQHFVQLNCLANFKELVISYSHHNSNATFLCPPHPTPLPTTIHPHFQLLH